MAVNRRGGWDIRDRRSLLQFRSWTPEHSNSSIGALGGCLMRKHDQSSRWHLGCAGTQEVIIFTVGNLTSFTWHQASIYLFLCCFVSSYNIQTPNFHLPSIVLLCTYAKWGISSFSLLSHVQRSPNLSTVLTEKSQYPLKRSEPFYHTAGLQTISTESA